MLLVCFSFAALGTRAAENLPLLRTAAEVRHLSPAEADRHYPVRLSGVITFHDEGEPYRAFRFIQDKTAGIYLYLQGPGLPPLATGQRVEVEGFSGKGEFAPVVVAERLNVLGPGDFPEPQSVSFEQLMSGQEDSQWVEIRGIARSVQFEKALGFYRIELAIGGGRLTAYARQLPTSNPGELADTTVRARGVCVTQFNLRRQLFDVRLMVPRAADLVIEKPAPVKEPFAIPAQSVSSLLQFALEGSYGHRVKVAGIVTCRPNDSTLYIQDESEGLYVQTSQPGRLSPGQRVEVLGFPAPGEYTPLLEDAVFRVVGRGTMPAADDITLDEALQGMHDCRLIRIQARVVDRSQQSLEELLVLETGGFIFHAFRPRAGSENSLLPGKGSTVAVTGICLIEKGGDWFAGGAWRAKSFRLLLRSPEDIQVLQRPPWWTLRRLLWALATLGVVVVFALAWVMILRRRVQQQTRIISQKLQAEAALKERYLDLFENASDIVYTHDLNGRLTAINQAGERLLRRNRKDILSRSIVDLVVPEQRATAQQWLEEVLRSSPAPTTEFDFAVDSAPPVRLEISTRIIEQNGHQMEVEGTARDVTERKRLERELLEVSNREQRRIGHDLHDGVCQQLAGIAFLTESLADRLQEKGVPESTEAERLGQLLSGAIAQTRGVARGLFPVRLEENGLASALEELAANASRLFQFDCVFTCEEAPQALDNGTAVHLYYIAQEAVANAAKHGKASRVVLALGRTGDRYALQITDNGQGFAAGAKQDTGMGLRIMHYRSRVIGATLELHSQPGQGTTVQCRFRG